MKSAQKIITLAAIATLLATGCQTVGEALIGSLKTEAELAITLTTQAADQIVEQAIQDIETAALQQVQQIITSQPTGG